MTDKLFDKFSQTYSKQRQEEMSLEDYLNGCKNDPMMYASAAERLLKAIGEPTIVDTSKNERLSRIFSNRTIRVYPAFEDFFGIEETIEGIVGFLRHAAQGLEEKRQILYMLGPVGSSKSSLAERLKVLMEEYPIYVLKAGDEISPVFESPLGLFNKEKYGKMLLEQYGISARYLPNICSPWAVKRLEDFGGDVSKFTVLKMLPSQLEQIGVVKTEPGDDNNQDISSLVGKVDLRKLEDFSQNDPDAYSYSGALCRGNQGLVEFVEMFKAPIKMLHPLLTATQEGNYKGTENIPAIPFNGIILAHSNESEWKAFKNNKNNEAFIDRICVVKVPYCLRVNEEVSIYKKYLTTTDLEKYSYAPQTLDILAKFTILSRIKEVENGKLLSKMRVYNGENLKDRDPRSKSIQEYREFAGVDEGMSGISTRFAFKALNKTFNYSPDEIAADPVHLFNVLLESIKQEQYNEDTERNLNHIIQDILAPEYLDWLKKELQRAYVESYDSYGQNVFDRYVKMADAWLQDSDYKNPDTGNMMDKESLDIELSKIEKPAEVANPKEFRNDMVHFCLRYQSANGGQNPRWDSYEKMKEVIEYKMFSAIEEILPVISFDTKKDKLTEDSHNGFVNRMKSNGYTETQIRRLVEYYLRARNSR